MRTTSAGGVIKSEVTQEDSKIDFNKVLQDLTRYQEELTLTLSDKVNDEKKEPQGTPVIQILPEKVHVHVCSHESLSHLVNTLFMYTLFF